MRTDLMSLIYHAVEKGLLPGSGVGYGGAPVMSIDEEGGFGVVGSKNVKEAGREGIWSVVECKSNYSGNSTFRQYYTIWKCAGCRRLRCIGGRWCICGCWCVGGRWRATLTYLRTNFSCIYIKTVLC